MGDTFRTYYDVLEVPESASPDEIREARNRLVAEYHPDKVPSHLKRVQADVTERLKEINAAYDVLKSRDSRAAYDAKLQALRRVNPRSSASPRQTGPQSTASRPSGRPSPPPPPPPPPTPPGSSTTQPGGAPRQGGRKTGHNASQLVLPRWPAGALLLFFSLIVVFKFLGPYAPSELVEHGVCPFEGCTYGERWKATADVRVLDAPPRSFGVSERSLAGLTLPAGAWVQTQTGLVISKRSFAKVRKGTDVGTPASDRARKNIPQLKEGDRVAIYAPLGEGCHTGWFRGDIFTICGAEHESSPASEWWVEVRLPDGSKKWARGDSEFFISAASLNTRLGEAIGDEKLSLGQRLAEVDRLIKEGAELNGDGGVYGIDPIETAISSNRTDLLRALMSRGLKVSTENACAHTTGSSLLRPGGDVMLDFLLSNGLRLDCGGEPPFARFLRWGISLDNYPVSRAIALAQVLFKHGYSVDARDREGRTVLDLIQQTDARGNRLAALREALLARSSTRHGPQAIVTEAFDAFRSGQSAAITDLMSDNGKKNELIYCAGAAVNCLQRNYFGLTGFVGRSTEAISESSEVVRIRLRTVWQDGQASRCQIFVLTPIDRTWRIDRFDVPQSCGP